MNGNRIFPTLETERLTLREMTSKDTEFYFHHFNIDKIADGCCFPGPSNLEIPRKELELYCINPFRENRGVRWGIIRKRDDKLIGTCGIYDWDKTSHRAEIGYDLDPAYWGQGIMTEALRAILRYGFEKIQLNRIQAIIDSKNAKSMRLVRRLEFKREGVLRQRSYFRGEFRDDIVFSLLRNEWTPPWPHHPLSVKRD
jgi:ribosomal-protein-alanine N-acetyltransferase